METHKKGLFTIPTLLTLFRLVLSPLLLPIVFVYLLPFNIFWVNVALACLFVLFSITDFLDGYLARKYEQETVLGQILDPIADKFLIYATLISLQVAGKIYFYWVVLLIGREFFMMGLRQLALENNFSVPVSFWGKIKTAFQMITLTVMILNPVQHQGLFEAFWWNGTETALLFATLFLSLFSAYLYNKKCIAEFNRRRSNLRIEDHEWRSNQL